MPPKLHALAALLVFCGLANAVEPAAAGIVKRVTGQVMLEREGQPAQPLTVGQAVQVGDRVRTGRDSSAGITLADDTLLAAGPDSQIQISKFAFNTTTQDGNLLLQLWHGTLNVVSGLIAKKSPDNMSIQTRTVVLGVRGTEVIVEASGEAP